MTYNEWIKYKGLDEDGELISKYKILTLLPSKQTIKIELESYIEVDRRKPMYYNVWLSIEHKRKNIENTEGKITGKDGVKSLLWAKKRLIEFEDIVKEDYKDKEIYICIGWYDNKRRNVYERGLKNLGYEYKVIFNKKYLIKKIQ